jgi:ring-1,2-phenylacetyl-CoA epoxidase subunit PaaD
MAPDRDAILDVLRTIPDPEMPISIVDLGLVEDVRVGPPSLEGPPGTGEGVVEGNDDRSPSGNSRSSTHPLTPSLPGRGDTTVVTIDLLPTFIGCPALEMIAGDVRAKVSRLPGVSEVRVNWLFDPPWSVDRITPAGRTSLKEHGVTVPDHGSHLHVPAHDAPQSVALRTSAIPCPFCGSSSTYLDSPFGPTRCRTIYYCESCRNSFEHMKRL